MAEHALEERSLKRLKKLINSKKTRNSYKILRVLCGTMRFKILLLLSKQKNGLTVSEMAKVLDASLSRISHQLRILRDNRLIIIKHKNREVLYAAADHRLKNLPFS